MGTIITQWVAKFIDEISSPVDGVTDAANEASEAVEDIGKAANGANDEIKKLSAMDLRASADAIKDLVNQFEQLMQPGMDFEVQMKEVQSITQMADEEMNKLGDSARELALIYGGDASAQLESFGAIIARFGPDIAKDNDAMASMGDNVSTLSKLMKNDAVGAMDALTTSMLQFGVDLTNPQNAAAEMTRMMHVMAAAGNEGASEVSDTAEALKNSGIAAKNANLSFEETNSALQALAQAGSKGSEAGVGLRNVLGKMGGLDIIPRKAREKLQQLGVDYDIVSNKTLPFTERLRELKKAQGDATLIAQIFGIENEKSAMALLDSIDAQEEMTKKITGTNAATESAAIVMESTSEKIGRMTAWINDLKISFFDVAGSITPFVTGLGTVAFTIANLAAATSGISQLIVFVKSLTIVTHLQTAAQWLLNIAMDANPVGLIILAIGALVSIIYVAIENYNEFGATLLMLSGPIGMFVNLIMTIQRNWDSVVAAFESDGILGAIKRIGIVIFDFILYPIQQMLELLSNVPGLGDLAGDGANAIIKLRESLNLTSPETDSMQKVNNADPDSTPIRNIFESPTIEPIVIVQQGNTGESQKAIGPLAIFQQGKTSDAKVSSGGTKGIKGAKDDKDGVKLSGGGGSGSGKVINMTVNMRNTFSGSERDSAQDVAQQICDKLSDGLAAI
ncbi:phage tail tape measure protein [Dysgonomonas sp. ZJ279]|uniref:phage tail tape measure protein n=1 Tax=Dysgonomonas sp. ZJ279 TaxID=2709796 RepID=UPI0013EC1763|nr:phage tail tape measure protein [Dysgonomonas sp. ZJ279]